MMMSQFKDSPCHHCDRRTLGCHSECEDYAKYKKDLDMLYDTYMHDNIISKEAEKDMRKTLYRENWQKKRHNPNFKY